MTGSFPLILIPCKIELKALHCEILNGHVAQKKEQDNYKDIPRHPVRNGKAGEWSCAAALSDEKDLNHI
jgi:hypothetical protein